MTERDHLKPITVRPRNRDRAQRARAAVTAYRKSVDTNETNPGTLLTDLLADLMHLAGQNRIVFEAALTQARSHFAAELMQEPPIPTPRPRTPPSFYRAAQPAAAAERTVRHD